MISVKNTRFLPGGSSTFFIKIIVALGVTKSSNMIMLCSFGSFVPKEKTTTTLYSEWHSVTSLENGMPRNYAKLAEMSDA